MMENNLPAENRKDKIRCGNCGNEDTFVLISESESLAKNLKTDAAENRLNDQIAEKQKYLAHYFEAQQRFGE